METGFEPVYAALQAAASPLGHSTVKAVKPSERMTGLSPAGMMVGDTGFEPVTSSVSRKRATTAPIARDDPRSHPDQGVEQSRWRRDLNPCRRICSPLPRLSATPPRRLRPLRADDEARTRDLNLGKVALYQLSYVRATRRLGGERPTEGAREL